MVGIHREFALGFEPEFHIPPFGLAPLYPDFVSAFADMVAFLQFGLRHFGLICEFVERLSRPVPGVPLRVATGPTLSSLFAGPVIMLKPGFCRKWASAHSKNASSPSSAGYIARSI